MNIILKKEIFKKEHVLLLSKVKKKFCISIYFPKVDLTNLAHSNHTYFMNMTRFIKKKLLDLKVSKNELNKIITYCNLILEDTPFWKKQYFGLVFFISQDFFKIYETFLNFPELVTIYDHFYLKPILSILNETIDSYYLLSISMNHIKLIKITTNDFCEVNLQNIPNNFNEFIKYYNNPNRQVRFLPSRGSGIFNFHGHGVWQNMYKKNIEQYFRLINKNIEPILNKDQLPLIFVGVEYLFHIFKQLNSYSKLVEFAIFGNPDEIKIIDIIKKIKTKFNALYQINLQKDLEIYQQSLGTGFASDNIIEIIPAAYMGKIAYLFVLKTAKQWGKLDLQTYKLLFLNQYEKESKDFFDEAIIKTFVNGGKIYILENKYDYCKFTNIAAVFRY